MSQIRLQVFLAQVQVEQVPSAEVKYSVKEVCAASVYFVLQDEIIVDKTATNS